MPGDERYTAHCGLYCKDCIPSSKRLFETADELYAILEGLRLEKYVALKAVEFPAFADYPAFLRVLKDLKSLQCKELCTGGGCKDDCTIRACVREKGYRGCWECEGYETCGLFDSLKTYHPDIIHNLQMIKRYGPDDWSEKRGRHYNWSVKP